MEITIVLPPNYKNAANVTEEYVAELSAIFDAAHADPSTTFPVVYDWCKWKSPFTTTVANDKVAKLVEAIEWFDADYRVITLDLGNGTSTVTSAGYQAW